MKASKITSLLAGLFIITGCSNAGGGGGGEIKPQPDLPQHYVEGTLHDVNINYDTGLPFVKNEKCDYKIVYEVTDENAIKAASFIANHIKLATGAKIEIEPCDGSIIADYKPTDKYISLGCEDLASKAGVSKTTKDIGLTGFQITTKDNSAFILVGGTEAYQTSAIVFLRKVIGYDAYDQETFTYDLDGSVLPSMDIVERPDFDYRQTDMDSAFDYPMGFTPGTIFMSVDGMSYHNTFKYLPPKTYYNDHPEFYGDGTGVNAQTPDDSMTGQLCYSAHGNKESFKLMTEITADKMLEVIDKNPTLNNITITIQDNRDTCKCAECQKFADAYNGSRAAVIVRFCNAVDNIVQAALEKKAQEEGTPKREIYTSFFAYHTTEGCPTHPNGDGTYSLITHELNDNQPLKCNDHVCAFMAPIESKFPFSFYQTINEKYANNVKGWGVATKRLYMWTYETAFRAYLFPYPTCTSNAESYRFFKQNNCMMLYPETQHNNNGHTTFHRLKEYVDAHLAFDVNLDTNALVDKYFKNVYRDAAATMRDLYEQECAWYYHLLELYGERMDNGGIYCETVGDTVEYWPLGLLQSWNALCDKAMSEIAPLEKSDPITYNLIKKKIVVESISPRYGILSLYKGMFSRDSFRAMATSFRQDAIDSKISMYRENADATLASKYIEWGI